jgi:hypothetical protein
VRSGVDVIERGGDSEWLMRAEAAAAGSAGQRAGSATISGGNIACKRMQDAYVPCLQARCCAPHSVWSKDIHDAPANRAAKLYMSSERA